MADSERGEIRHDARGIAECEAGIELQAVGDPRDHRSAIALLGGTAPHRVGALRRIHRVAPAATARSTRGALYARASRALRGGWQTPRDRLRVPAAARALRRDWR